MQSNAPKFPASQYKLIQIKQEQCHVSAGEIWLGTWTLSDAIRKKRKEKMLENCVPFLSQAKERNVLQSISESLYDSSISGSQSVFVEQSRF